MGAVERAHMLGDHQGEVIEVDIPESPKHKQIVEKPLRDLHFPDGALVGAVVRNDEVYIADGDTILRPGDRVLVVSLLGALHKVEELLS